MTLLFSVISTGHNDQGTASRQTLGAYLRYGRYRLRPSIEIDSGLNFEFNPPNLFVGLVTFGILSPVADFS